MNPWMVAGLCLGGAAFVGWGSLRVGLRWPVLALACLLVAIAWQLWQAAGGLHGYHDLSALLAQFFTTVPALVGVGLGLAIAGWQGRGMGWTDGTGVVTGLGLCAATGLTVATLLI